MIAEYEIDELDRKILNALIGDGRKAYLEIARELAVSGGTVHQRVDKMQQAGILKGFTAVLDRSKLGHQVTVLVGLHLQHATHCTAVTEALSQFPQVLEVHYTSGSYALIAKVVTRSIPEYYDFLSTELQGLQYVRATESFFCMASPVAKEICV